MKPPICKGEMMPTKKKKGESQAKKSKYPVGDPGPQPKDPKPKPKQPNPPAPNVAPVNGGVS
jgi:hypothetical protein